MDSILTIIPFGIFRTINNVSPYYTILYGYFDSRDSNDSMFAEVEIRLALQI